MNELFGREDVFPISLGYNCTVKSFIEVLGQRDKIPYLRQPFDWLGTSMWSICKVIENDFTDFANREKIQMRRRFTNSSDEYPTNIVYNIPFLHDYGGHFKQISDAKWAEVTENYNRRIERWKTTLASDKHKIFIRLEMHDASRIQYFDDEYMNPLEEKTYIEKFADMMKDRGVSYTILFISRIHPTYWDTPHRICTIHIGKGSGREYMSGTVIDGILRNNRDFIHSCICSSTN